MDDKTTPTPPADVDAHAGEPEKGPAPTAAELQERADAKAAQVAEGDKHVTETDAAAAAAVAKEAATHEARRRLDQVADAIAYGREAEALALTDAERALLAEAKIDVDAELQLARDWFASHGKTAEAPPADAAEAEAPAGDARDFDEPTIARLQKQMTADRERRQLGMAIAQRVHAAVDGVHARHALTAMDVDGMDATAMAELVRAAGAMGWRVQTEGDHGLAILRR